MSNKEKIDQALGILESLGLPEQQRNARTAMCLLATLNLKNENSWDQSENPVIGIRGILDFIRSELRVQYAENTRETIRDESIKPMVAAGILIKNPDKPDRATNSPDTAYQITQEALELFRKYSSQEWDFALHEYLAKHQTLIDLYARKREKEHISIHMRDGKEINISSGEHSMLIKQILEEFKPRFAPYAITLYVGDTSNKWGLFNEKAFTDLGIQVSKHGQMPDVVLYEPSKKWLFLIESVTSNGPIDGRRHEELSALFAKKLAELVFVTAFPDRKVMRKYLSVLAWDTEVWIADAPDHLIHFNGDKFLGPH